LKLNQDNLRIKAENTKDPKDVQKWRQATSSTKKAILQAKRDSFNKFISTIDYRKDSTKTYSFLNKLQNKYERPQKEPFSINGRVIESDAETANTFASSVTKKTSICHTK